MGCCVSTSRASSPTSPYGNTTPANQPAQTDPLSPHTHHASASSLSPSAIAPVASQSPLITHPDTNARHTRTSQHSSLTSPRTASAPSNPQFRHPNKPLNSAPNSSQIQPPPFQSLDLSDAGARLTMGTLLRERAAFFETRVTGRSEVWAAVRLVCELIEQGELGEAQAVLEAAGCTCPSGDVHGRKGGIYDELGEKYVVPSWVVGTPAGVVEDGEAELKEAEGTVEGKGKRTDEKGKGKMAFLGEAEGEVEREGDVKVKVRLSHTARDLLVRIRDGEKVSGLIRRVIEQAELSPYTKVKVGYLGKILHENESLAAQGWAEGHILNIYVFE